MSVGPFPYRPRKSMRITIYTKPGCHLCEDTLSALDRLTPQYNLDVNEVNILDDMALYEQLKYEIPVVDIEDGRLGRLTAPIDEPTLRMAFDIALRAGSGPKGGGVTGGTGPSTDGANVVPAMQDSFIDRGISYIARHWLGFALTAMGIFVILPWLAPIFAALGWWNLANPIYTAYAFQCHQLPEREAHIFGYEVASCMRCNALYGGMFLFGLLYGAARDKKIPALSWLVKPLPVWGFGLMMLPILIDGISHML